jgi:hypothetical protein
MKTALSFIAICSFAFALSAQYPDDKKLQSITPDSGPVAGGTSVTVQGDMHFGGVVVSPCGDPQVYLGGLMMQLTSSTDTGFTFVTPAYTAGTFDILVDRCGYRAVMKNAFSYVSGGRSWERVLLPVYLQNDLPGAFGSVWRTQLTALNLGNQAIFRGRSDRTGSEITYGPFVPNIDSDQHQPGRLVYISPAYASKLVRFNLLVRDLSREASTLGTTVPVVHEDDAFGPFDGMLFAKVPLGEPYRQKLRVYRMDLGEPQKVLVHFNDNGDELGLIDRDTSAEPAAGDFQIYPGYFEVDLNQLSNLAGHKQVDVQISVPYGRYWAYISVTNNDTQQVTTILP